MKDANSSLTLGKFFGLCAVLMFAIATLASRSLEGSWFWEQGTIRAVLALFILASLELALTGWALSLFCRKLPAADEDVTPKKAGT